METLRYTYRASAWKLALAALFFAGCAVIMAKAAIGNDRGLVINGIIHLDPGSATVFYWVIFAISLLFVAGGMLGVVRALGPAQEVTLDRVALSAPRTGLRSELVRVPVASITGVETMRMRSQEFLIVRHREGKLTISGGMLPHKQDLGTLAAALEERSRGAQGDALARRRGAR